MLSISSLHVTVMMLYLQVILACKVSDSCNACFCSSTNSQSACALYAVEVGGQGHVPLEHVTLTVKTPARVDTQYVELQDVSFAIELQALLCSVSLIDLQCCDHAMTHLQCCMPLQCGHKACLLACLPPW